MSVLERESVYSPPPDQSAGITPLQPAKEVFLNPDAGKNSYLAGTGFDLLKEMARFIFNYNQNLKAGKEPLQALIISASELEVNIRTYIVEYIQTRTILPHLNRLEEVEEQIRMVGQNGVPVVSGITAEERNGSVLNASEQVEDFLTNSGLEKTKNRIAVINSPLGHSGLIDKQGKIIRYKSNQTMVFWTDKEGQLHGVTIVSDLDKKQSKQLSIDLGIEETLLDGATEVEQVAKIVSNPALFSYGQSISNPAEYVLEKILAIRGNSDIKLEQEDGTVETRSVAQTYQDIKKFESLLQFSPVWEDYLQRLRQVVIYRSSNLGDPEVQAEIAQVIEKVILDITVDFLQENKPHKFILSSKVVYFQPASSGPIDSRQAGPYAIYGQNMDRYLAAASFLRTRSGCNGGGGSRVSVRGSSLGSTVSAVSGGVSEVKIGGTCEHCDESSADNHYHCPDCNKRYADETDKSAEQRTKNCPCGFQFGC